MTTPRRVCGFPGLQLGTLLEIRVTPLMATQGARPKACYISLDVSVELAATDVADLQLHEDPEELLIEKAAIQRNDDRYLLMNVFANLLDDVPDHPLGRLGVVGIPVARAKDDIDDEPPPCHPERLETLDSMDVPISLADTLPVPLGPHQPLAPVGGGFFCHLLDHPRSPFSGISPLLTDDIACTRSRGSKR